MYIAPRYHTNQAAIMKNLIKEGHEVKFLSHYRGKVEDYSVIEPDVIGYSKLFLIWEKFYLNILHKNDCRAVDMKLKYGFPPIAKLKRQIKDFMPDVIIIRERSIYSICTYMSCTSFHIPFILYNQSPLWEPCIMKDLPHRIVKSMLPKTRMTPVMGNKDKGVLDNNTYFVPFVIEPMQIPEIKKWFSENKISIFCIGKYEKRKNISMLLEVFKELSKEYELHLTIAGECSTEFHREYLNEQEKFIFENSLSNKVDLFENLSREEINTVFKTTDLFIIPSTDEPASISQMEAMAFSIPVICSDENGTACYVEDGKDGRLFRDNDKDDLKNKIIELISNRETLVEMGTKSYHDIEKMCSFSAYFEGLTKCYKDALDNIRK